MVYKIVSRLKGITTALLRQEKPLSAVLPMFFEWVASTVAYVNQATKTSHYPGTIPLYYTVQHKWQ